MKIFKWWHRLIISTAFIIVAALFLLVAFQTTIENVQRWSLFSTMFFGLSSVFLSLIALCISIQTYVSNARLKQEKLENEAKNFIILNSNEISYIPLCIMASAYDRHRNFNRKIYLEFNKLNNNQQKEVLRQLNYDCCLVEDNAWIDEGLDRIQCFIERFDLGVGLLHDDAKYYRQSISFKGESYDLKIENIHVFQSNNIICPPNYVIINGKPVDKGVTFDYYLRNYIGTKLKENVLIKVAKKTNRLFIRYFK